MPTSKETRYTDLNGGPKLFALFRDLGLLAIAVTTTLMAGCPYYNVWQQGLHGKAELARAQQNRMIRVQEAEAAKESASLLADAEIQRAKGVAEANRIIGNSLHGNEAYLRYLWIHQLAETKNQIIYVPTEASLPILEAGRRGGVE